MSATVEIQLGEVKYTANAKTMRGSRTKPIDIQEKIRLGTAHLNQDKINKAMNMIRDFDRLGNVHELMDILEDPR